MPCPRSGCQPSRYRPAQLMRVFGRETHWSSAGDRANMDTFPAPTEHEGFRYASGNDDGNMLALRWHWLEKIHVRGPIARLSQAIYPNPKYRLRSMSWFEDGSARCCTGTGKDVNVPQAAQVLNILEKGRCARQKWLLLSMNTGRSLVDPADQSTSPTRGEASPTMGVRGSCGVCVCMC